MLFQYDGRIAGRFRFDRPILVSAGLVFSAVSN